MAGAALPIAAAPSLAAAQAAHGRSQFFLDVASGLFLGFNRLGARVSQGLINSDGA
jgi:hypothetical protein